MKGMTPIKAIRAKCLDCVGSPKMARECQENKCPLYRFRLGHNPTRKGIGGNPKIGLLSKNRQLELEKIFEKLKVNG